MTCGRDRDLPFPTSRLTRAVSSMISPLTANGANRQSHQQHQQMDQQLGARDRLMSTPSGDLQNLRLQSCSNLMTAESPVSTRSAFAHGVTPSKSER